MLTKHIQVLNFMKVQVVQECNWMFRPEFIIYKTREELAEQVARGEGAEQWTWRQIMINEVRWMKDRFIKQAGKGRYSKITSMLNQETVILVVQEYNSQAGEGKYLT